MQKIITLLFLTFLSTFLYSQNTTINNDTLRLFLNNVFLTIQENSVYKSSFNWTDLKMKVFKGIDTAKSYDDLIPAIKSIYQLTKDKHGAVYLNGKRIAMNDQPTFAIRKVLQDQFKNGIPKIKTQVLDNKYGYILIPGNNAFGENSSTLSQEIQDSLCKLNPKNLRGLIIDLRLNTGGSMYPMLCGLNEIVGNGMIGSFANLNGKPITKWKIESGKLYLDTQRIAVVHISCRFPKYFKVAVLLSQITSSAGEDLTVALKGRPNTLFIGEKTSGYTTSTSVHYVNGQLLTVSSAFIADRTGKVYYENILPDIEIINGDDFEKLLFDTKVIAAVNWMKKH